MEYRYTPGQILDDEHAYPGIWNDLSTEIWQRHLVKEQVDNDQGDDE